MTSEQNSIFAQSDSTDDLLKLGYKTFCRFRFVVWSSSICWESRSR